MDHADPEVLGSGHVRDLDWGTLVRDNPERRSRDATEDFHQRGLAGTVLADECVDLARKEVKVAVHEGVDTGEVLDYPAHFKEGLGHEVVSCGSL